MLLKYLEIIFRQEQDRTIYGHKIQKCAFMMQKVGFFEGLPSNIHSGDR